MRMKSKLRAVFSFLIPFFIVGGWNAFMIAMHGPAMPDEATLRDQRIDIWVCVLFRDRRNKLGTSSIVGSCVGNQTSAIPVLSCACVCPRELRIDFCYE